MRGGRAERVHCPTKLVEDAATVCRRFNLGPPHGRDVQIYDAFMFNHEMELLEMRLNELDGIVDSFVLVEMRVTHGGQPKPLYFDQARAQFEPFLDSIHHYVADPPTTAVTEAGAAMGRTTHETHQRNSITKALQQMGVVADDPHMHDPMDQDVLILVSDLDEIPKRDAIWGMKHCELPHATPVGFRSKYHVYSLHWMASTLWTSPTVLSPHNFVDSLDRSRRSGTIDPNPLLNAAWHVSWGGGPAAIKAKLATLQETSSTRNAANDAKILQAIREGRGLLNADSFRWYDAELGRADVPCQVKKDPSRFPWMWLSATRIPPA